MSYILGLDGSQFQGTGIDFNQVKAAGYQFWLQRMSYSYPGQPNKYDPSANANYNGASAAGMIVGGYHKIGWTDPIAEADFFIGAMSPLAENDLLAFDEEPSSDVPIPDNWSQWEQAFVQRIHDRTNVWALNYKNISMFDGMPPQGVVTNCASWVAAPSFGWNDTVPVNVIVTIQQGPTAHIPGITANVCDTDAFFGEGSTDQLIEQLKKLGYHASQPTPVPTPVPIPPAPTPTPPVEVSVPEPVPPVSEPPAESSTKPEPTLPVVSPAPQIPPTHLTWFEKLLQWIKDFFNKEL